MRTSYTSYFANLRNLPKDIAPIAICAKPPQFYKGAVYKKLAPPYDVLMKYKRDGDKEAYVREFKKRVLARLPDARTVLSELSYLAGGKQFALICYEKPGDFCHRHLVAEWLLNCGYLCLEYEGDMLSGKAEAGEQTTLF